MTTKANESQSSLKTYVNSDIGFSFQYPDNWNEVTLNLEERHDEFVDGKRLTSDAAGINGLPVYFDSSKVFTFEAASKNLREGILGTTLHTVKLDPNWTARQIELQMGFRQSEQTDANPSVLFVKKLSEKTVLLAEYMNGPECSPDFSLKVVTPLNDSYPNFEIDITIPSLGSDPILQSFESAQTAMGEPSCDESKPYQQIADKIEAGTYSDAVNGYIKTSQAIADSLMITTKSNIFDASAAKVGDAFGEMTLLSIAKGPSTDISDPKNSLLSNENVSAEFSGAVEVRGTWNWDANVGYCLSLDAASTQKVPVISTGDTSQSGIVCLANSDRELKELKIAYTPTHGESSSPDYPITAQIDHYSITIGGGEGGTWPELVRIAKVLK